MKYAALSTVLAGALWVLAGCGSGSAEPDDIDYSQLRAPDPALASLSNQHPPSAFSEYLRNGIRLQVAPERSRQHDTGSPMPAEAADDGAGNGNGSGGTDQFSGTNVHVEGVDEADRLKYDGAHLFVAETPYYSYAHFAATADIAVDDSGASPPQQPPSQALRILSTDPETLGATEMARYEFERADDSSLTLSQLYTLASDNSRAEAVAALSDSGMTGDVWGWGRMAGYYQPQGATRVDLVNVESPSNPALTWSIELEGQLRNSRKIGDVLYLVTRYAPRVEGVYLNPQNRSERERNEELIRAASVSDLLPSYRVNDGAPEALVREENCYLPKAIEANEGYADLVTISAIDLRQQQVVSSACVNARLSGLYMSLDSLYLGSSDGYGSEEKTALHKFSVQQGDIDYRGSGLVPGGLNWASPSFSMDERDGYLRVVTSVRHRWDDIDHGLHVLRESADEASDELSLVTRLPNEEHPEAIGEPGEDIFAVRFLGDRAYIVTFERVDPLYVIDLSDNEHPFIAGELKIPGVSTYLHPVGDGYLVSVGQDMDANGMPLGVKVELFDVREDDHPRSIATDVLGSRGSWSEALHDLRAFNFLSMSDDQLRFTLPVSRSDDYQWRDAGLHLYEINEIRGEEATLDPVGSMIVERRKDGEHYWPHDSGNGRSRLHNDTVYYLHGNQVWASHWSDPDNLQGPY